MAEAQTDEDYSSSLPQHTRAMVYGSGTWHLPGYDDLPCEGARHHSPRPLFTSDTPLVLREWWPDDGYGHWAWAPKAPLCGTCRDNLTLLLQMLHATDGALEWVVRREFGNDLRALALKGWEWFAEHRPAEVADSPPKG